MMSLKLRSGMVLLEVIVAMTIFVTAGLSMATWVRQTMLTVDQARRSALDTQAASDYLDRIALWPREDLDRHLGTRQEGAWVVQTSRPTPTIYEVAIGDSGTTRRLLQTWLYRRERPASATYAN